jgi:hypothetical protein
MPTEDTRSPEVKQLDECFAIICKNRNEVASFYDVRLVFACYTEIVASLAAGIIKNKVYAPAQMGALLADMVAEALTRDSQTVLELKHGTDVIQGTKQ